MKERPILFSAPMVRAILDGRKTQTRRVIKPQPGPCNHAWMTGHEHLPTSFQSDCDGFFCRVCGNGMQEDSKHPEGVRGFRCPYGQPGDHLWVRETWYCDHIWAGEKGDAAEWRGRDDQNMYYRADVPSGRFRDAGYWSSDEPSRSHWRPSIHMPRWASRITLEVTGVRVERLQEIGEEDARSEGCEHLCNYPTPSGYTHAGAFAELWDQINFDRAPWHSNPWVWIVEFKVITPAPKAG